jgi:cobalt-zinc-cadmium efflux system membrane fusion protein
VPQNAIVYEDVEARVWVVGDDGAIVARRIATGRISDGMVEVRSGLSPGEKIVTSGALFIDRAGGTG